MKKSSCGKNDHKNYKLKKRKLVICNKEYDSVAEACSKDVK